MSALLAACGREPPAAAAARSPAAAEAAAASPDPHPQFAAANISCETCHPCGAPPVHAAAWMDQASSSFHATSANAGLSTCQGCHGTALDGTGTTAVSCAACHGTTWASNCTMCHGGDDNKTGAPPRATWGNRDDVVRIGSHTAHVGATHGLSTPVACATCHVSPADAFAAGHIDGSTATVAFSGLASSSGLAPAWDRAAGSCSATYCHGATLTGGKQKTPAWTTTDGTQRACDSCHGSPPQNAFHTRTDLDCASCHPAGYSGSGRTVASATHVDGTVDLPNLTCTSCHGDATRGAGIAAAPPFGTHAETATTTLAVGAHLSHLASGRLRAPIACTECHAVPASNLHANGVVDVVWGGLAANGVTPSWTRATATCSSTYCHGATLQGGTLTAPVWTRVDGTQAACGTCHGAPPPPPHVRNPDCGHCHSGYTATSVNLATHIDGKVDVVALDCKSCHGSVANAAPPIGTGGETASSTRAVGAHQQHVQGSAIKAAIDCGECHVVPSTNLHANGTVAMAWGALATTGGAKPQWDGNSCASTYCHGSTLAAGGWHTAPVWTQVDGTQAACDACHGDPPPSPHPQNTSCGNCHTGYTSTSVVTATHVDGNLDVQLSCNSCHGSPGSAAPPAGTHGETATTARAVGAHQQHLKGGTTGKAVACEECHVVPTSMTHSNGTVTVTFGTLSKTGGAAPAWNGATCASTYCHGGTLAGGSNTAPAWTKVDGTQDACGTCHGVSMAAGAVLPDPLHPARPDLDCAACHAGYSAASKTTVVATHVDGIVQVSVTCTSCHGDPSRANTALNPKLAAAPPDGSHGETATTARAVGAHLKHLQGGTLTNGVACTECHTLPADSAPIHQSGSVVLTWGTLARTSGSVPAWTPSTNTCSSNWCHGAKLTGGSDTTPIWTKVDGTQDACGTCHGIPPTSGQHGRSEHRVSCGYCHGGTYTQTVADKTRHVNGVFEVDGPRIRSWNSTTKTCQPTCHGTETWSGSSYGGWR